MHLPWMLHYYDTEKNDLYQVQPTAFFDRLLFDMAVAGQAILLEYVP